MVRGMSRPMSWTFGCASWKIPGWQQVQHRQINSTEPQGMPFSWYLPLEKTPQAVLLYATVVLSLSLQFHTSFLGLLIFLPTLTCELQGALLLPCWYLALNFPFSLLQTAKRVWTRSRLRSLPHFASSPWPSNVQWLDQRWMDLLTKQLLWKENWECHGFSSRSSDFNFSDAVSWRKLSQSVIQWSCCVIRNLFLWIFWEISYQGTLECLRSEELPRTVSLCPLSAAHHLHYTFEGSSAVTSCRISWWLVIREKLDALHVYVPGFNLRKLIHTPLNTPWRSPFTLTICQWGKVRELDLISENLVSVVSATLTAATWSRGTHFYKTT